MTIGSRAEQPNHATVPSCSWAAVALLAASLIRLSHQWDIHPEHRGTAKSTVKNSGGNPMAR